MESLLLRSWGTNPIKVKSRLCVLILSCWGASLFFSINANAQASSPADCKTGCTSNDVQIQSAYLSDSLGNKLPNNFVCPVSGTAKVFLTLELTTNTPRVGVVIYDTVKTLVNGSPGAFVTVLTQCFGVALGNTAHKVTFTNPFFWKCGTSIVLTGVFIGWGTGNTNFCTGSGFQCPATSSKCFSLPPGQFIAIQIPNSQNGSETVCANVPGGTIGTFELDTITVTTASLSTVSINYWQTNTAGVLSNCIPTSQITAYSSGSATIFAKIKNNSDTTAFSISTITLTVNNVSAGSIGSDQTICSGGDPAAFTSAAGTGAGTISYQWQSNTTGCAGAFTNISGQTSATYDVPAGLAVTTYYRRIDTSKINGVACANTSNCVTVTVNNVSAGSISSSQTICSGSTPSQITGTTGSGGGTLSYQWLSNTTSCSGPWSAASGTNTGQNYQPGALAATTYYKRVTISTLNGAACRDTSNCVTITVITVSAGSIAGTQSVCSGNPPTAFTSVSAGTGTAYQWINSTTGCSGPWSAAAGTNTGATYQAGDLTQNTYYKRVRINTVNGVSCYDTSNCITVTVNPLPTTPTVHYNPPACDSVVFSLTISNVATGNVYTLNDKNGQLIAGALPSNPYTAPSNSDFNFTNIPAGSGYSVQVASGSGCFPNNSPAVCGTPSAITRAVINTHENAPSEPAVKAYPNPFSDKINFVVTTPVSGKGSLDIYNMMGQKIKTVYQGFIAAGTQTFQMSSSRQQVANLVYVLRIGDKKVTGRILQINQ